MSNQKTSYKVGAIWGFIFGTLGLGLIALLALMSPTIEMLTKPLFVPSQFIANLISNGDALNGRALKIAYVFCGIVYAVIGVIVQFVVKTIREVRKLD